MVIKSKITSLGLSSKVDQWIVETGANKSEVLRRINEQLEASGKKPMAYLTVSKYIDEWQEQRLENVRSLAKFDQLPLEDSAKWVTDAVKAMLDNSDYEQAIADTIIGNINVENGVINVSGFLSIVAIAGLAKILKNPDMVSMADAMKAAQILAELGGSGNNKQVPTFISQAVKIYGNSKEILDQIDIVDAEFN